MPAIIFIIIITHIFFVLLLLFRLFQIMLNVSRVYAEWRRESLHWFFLPANSSRIHNTCVFIVLLLSTIPPTFWSGLKGTYHNIRCKLLG